MSAPVTPADPSCLHDSLPIEATSFHSQGTIQLSACTLTSPPAMRMWPLPPHCPACPDRPRLHFAWKPENVRSSPTFRSKPESVCSSHNRLHLLNRPDHGRLDPATAIVSGIMEIFFCQHIPFVSRSPVCTYACHSKHKLYTYGPACKRLAENKVWSAFRHQTLCRRREIATQVPSCSLEV